MQGIYKITNKTNNKSYIGQSNNISRRISEHFGSSSSISPALDAAIKKYGVQNFTYEVLEEVNCPTLRNERETFWIMKYQTFPNGYNLNNGGDNQSQGEGNGRSILTEEDVIKIRVAYRDKKSRRDTYKMFEDKIKFGTFAGVWDGSTWSHIMPEVFTDESKEYYSKEASNGERNAGATLTNQEVLEIRQRYVNETAKEIYKDYESKLKYQTLQQILWGRTYKEVPIYSKRNRKWINPPK